MASEIVQDFLSFLDNSPTPYHAVKSCVDKLTKAGFVELNETSLWQLQSGRYYVKRNESSIIAFILPEKWQELPYQIFGAHTDSPNLKLKANISKLTEEYLQFNVEPYGGLLVSTWLDRDLSVAGRIFFSTVEGPVSKLVDFNEPICRVSNLAIHLNHEVNKKGALFNSQTELSPIFANATEHLPFINELANVGGFNPEDILSFDLSLYDTQRASLGGLHKEFIFSARLDNLASCHIGLTALLETQQSNSTFIPMISFFDHEEVGSQSVAGAASNFLGSTISRIHANTATDQKEVLLRNSFLISADMAHALHPNYSKASDENHNPKLNQGPVVKLNQNQRYATSAETTAIWAQLCRDNEVPYQLYMNRNDKPCGSTIGPALATKFGINSIDVGNPMLSMHSIREMCGSDDHEAFLSIITSYFNTDIAQFSID